MHSAGLRSYPFRFSHSACRASSSDTRCPCTTILTIDPYFLSCDSPDAISMCNSESVQCSLVNLCTSKTLQIHLITATYRSALCRAFPRKVMRSMGASPLRSQASTSKRSTCASNADTNSETSSHNFLSRAKSLIDEWNAEISARSPSQTAGGVTFIAPFPSATVRLPQEHISWVWHVHALSALCGFSPHLHRRRK